MKLLNQMNTRNLTQIINMQPTQRIQKFLQILFQMLAVGK